MAKSVISLLLFSFVFAFSAHAQQSLKIDQNVDFNSIGPPPKEFGESAVSPAAPANPPPVSALLRAIPTPGAPLATIAKPTVNFEAKTPEELSRLIINSPTLPPFAKIASPVIPRFAEIATPQLPRFAEIPEPDTNFEHAAAAPLVVPTVGAPSLPAINGKLPAPPAAPFIPSGGEGGGSIVSQNQSSTPVAQPLNPYVFGQSSTPIAAPPPPNITQRFVFGQSSTPISSPLAPYQLPIQSFTPNRQPLFNFGQSSTPIGVTPQQQPLAPYNFGPSSTPISSTPIAPYLGISSTPRGLSSSPVGLSSTPQGRSSTPSGGTSTPQGPSSTPRAGR